MLGVSKLHQLVQFMVNAECQLLLKYALCRMTNFVLGNQFKRVKKCWTKGLCDALRKLSEGYEGVADVAANKLVSVSPSSALCNGKSALFT